MFYQYNAELVSKSNQLFVQGLLDCKNFEKSDRLLGYSKGRGTTWFLATNDILKVDSVLRHYYRGGLFGKIVKDRYWFQSLEKTRAAQEFTLLNQMEKWGLPVPRPIAFKITRNTFSYQADILLEKINNTEDLSQLLQHQTLSNEEYRKIGKLIRQLHDHQVHHSDLNIHNILREKGTGKFWLIDFDKCNIQQGSKWKKENLARLLRSFNKEVERLKINFSQENWQALENGYNS